MATQTSALAAARPSSSVDQVSEWFWNFLDGS